ncbi:hypothetical protein NDU88_004515 [Pleurodeles waltl]|uniref:Uncharacterized protein n=1 Tax=Pleurodeles waltl TaxID=8319 RepID=A0AAV7VL11_PLEWA|nr:hypothetical protein NDU88_004515 [Pleurodeles waltl]
MEQPDDRDPVPGTLQATLDKILGGIEDTNTTLQRKIGQVSVELGLLRPDHLKLADRDLKKRNGANGIELSTPRHDSSNGAVS